MANGQRINPFRGFKYRIDVPGFASTGVRSVTGMNTGETEIAEYREGNMESTVTKNPGLTSYGDITIVRGYSENKDFQRWRNEVQISQGGDDADSDNDVPNASFRKNFTVHILNEFGSSIRSFGVINAWPMSYNLGDLNAESSDILEETLVIVNEGIRSNQVTDGLGTGGLFGLLRSTFG